MKRAKIPSKFRHPWAICALLASSAFASSAVADSAESKERATSLRTEAKAYEHGTGGPRDPDKAVALYCEAARLGDVEAQYNLGWMYAMGRGIARDDETAAYFFAMASKQGDALATRMLRQVGEPSAKTPACLVPPPPPAEADNEGKEILAKATPEHRKVMSLIQKLAPEYGIYPRLAMAIIRAESNFNPLAVSPKNAQGLMQLIPETAARFNVKNPFDPEQNIRGGLSYLRWLLAYYQGNIALVAAAYNAGEGTVNRYAGIPPYPETQGYVKRIREVFLPDDHPFDARITPPSPDMKRIISAKRMM